MLLLEGTSLKYFIHEHLTLQINRIQVHDNQRIGLVGRNGCGKTTLLHLIAGESLADEGTIESSTFVKLVPQLKRTDTTKSGGEITQEYLQDAFNSQAGLLLLDEPTTNLDQSHMEWLEKELQSFQGGLIVVSHDRVFLDQLCTEIWELDDGRITIYTGNYSDYAKQKELERNEQQLAYEKYEREKQQLEEAIRKKEERAQRATKKPKHLGASDARQKGAKPYYANKQKKLRKTASAFETRLEKLDKVKKPKELPNIKMDMLQEEPLHHHVVLRAEQMKADVGNRQLWKPVDFYLYNGEKLAVIGENGVGKTTLLKKILHDDKEVKLSPAIKIGYFAQNLTILDGEKTILENVQSSSAQNETFIRTVLARMHFFNNDVHKKVKMLSGGEKVKVSLSKIILSEANMLILDEPTNYLDIASLEALETLLTDYVGTVIFVTHDRMFVRHVATKILEIKNEHIRIFDGTYEAYEKQQIASQEKGNEDELLLLETKIADVISRLSIDPSEALEQAFKNLLEEKRRMNKN